ncbi:DUF488 domain-containing protein [Dysgonomonas sp.]
MVQVKLKRVYENTVSGDGFRVLVDRLWPRGVKKDDLHYDWWAKEISPSPELRKWVHEDPISRWDDFTALYRKELSVSGATTDFIEKIKKYDVVTLLYAAKDPARNHAMILKSYLMEILS